MLKNKKKILVVDHDALILETLSRVLKEECGFDSCGIHFIGDEKELMGRVYNVDMVLMDIMMPRINGLELTRKIRNKGLHIPIILMTGNNTLENALESMKSGADDLILKPIGIDELTSSIESVFNQRSSQISNRSRIHLTDAKLKFEDISHIQSTNIGGPVIDYYETGELMAELTYKEGKLDGVSRVYRRSGTLLFEGSFRNDLTDGRSRWFTIKGKVYIEENHNKGDRLQRIIFDSTGKVRQDLLYT